MPRYFIEVSYKGTRYSGFQVQQNANSVQAEVEKALKIYYKKEFSLTGSSRTDAGVHALQNYFHFDSTVMITDEVYHLNAILPADIVIKRIYEVDPGAHCRFDASSREYQYNIYRQKDPFQQESAWFYPYSLDMNCLQEAADEIKQYTDFTSFSKRNTQVCTFECSIKKSQWQWQNSMLTYQVESNRFLRGMVRGLVGTMLHVGRRKISMGKFRDIILAGDCTKVDFAVPPHGLFLMRVNY